jgi:ADP-heptose:LPS heptosyltransferase
MLCAAAMRILFVTSNRIGDAVLSSGLLDHLIRVHPNAWITVVCGPVAEGLFARMPNRERTIVMEKRRFGLHWPRLWAAVVGTRWDLVVDIRASALSYLLYTRRRAVMRKRPGHKTAQLAAVLELATPPLPVVWTAEEDRDRAAALLPPGSPIIALAPTANWTGKVWPPDRFVALFRELSAREDFAGARAAILAGHGPSERALAIPVLAALPDAIDLGGKLTLAEAAACLARAALFVGNDSGLMHIAAAAGTPTLGLFGPTPAAEYAPAGRAAAAVVARGPSMDDLPVADVVAAFSRLLPAPCPITSPA